MGRDFSEFPAQKLESLGTGPTVEIHHLAQTAERTTLIKAKFSLRMITALSEDAKKQLNTTEPKPKLYIVGGGSVEHIKSILDWAVACCDSGTVLSVPAIRQNPLYNAAMFVDAALVMEIPTLVTKLEQLLEPLLSKLPSTPDIRTIYAKLPASHALQLKVANLLAVVIFERRPHARAAYAALRSVIPAFDNDVKAALGPLFTARHNAIMEARANATRVGEEREKVRKAAVGERRWEKMQAELKGKPYCGPNGATPARKNDLAAAPMLTFVKYGGKKMLEKKEKGPTSDN